MTGADSFRRRMRSRRVALASAGLGAALVAAPITQGSTETIAAFTDSVFASAGFSAGKFGVQTSLTNIDSDYSDHSGNPLVLHEEGEDGFTFTPPIAVSPGGISYAGFYIRRTPETEDLADVTISLPARDDNSSETLWNNYLTYSVHYAPAAEAGEARCSHIDSAPGPSGWQDLVASRSFGNSTPLSNGTFTLGELATESADGDPLIVCFRFALDSSIVTGSPSANGQSVYPTWTFTSESRQP